MSKLHDLQRIRFDLTSIRLLIATAEQGSVTAAAERMNLAVTAASRRIADLEDQFGMPLFERRPHGMALTEGGRCLLAHARSLMAAVERMHDDALAYGAGGRGLVRLGVCTSAALQFLPDDLRLHQAERPEIVIETEEATSREVLKAVIQGRAEVGIVEREAVHVPEGLASRFYRRDRLVLVTHRDHALAACASVGLQDILAHELIGLETGSAVGALLTRLAAQAGMRLRSSVRARSFDTMLAMIQAQLGAGLVPRAIAQWLAASPAFRRVEIDGDWADRDFVICHRREPDVSSTCLTVVNFLARERRAA